MTSEPASVTSHLREPDRDQPLEAARIPLKHKGLDIASQMSSVKAAESDLARAVGTYSASVEHTLSVIEAIEQTVQRKRRQIDEIRARQDVLAREYRELGKSLDSAAKDLAQQFAGIIRDLEKDLPLAGPPADEAPESGANGAECPADKAQATSDTAAKPPAEDPPESAKASALDLDAADLPPVPEFLGDRHKPSNQTDGGEAGAGDSGPRGWWRQAKKG